MQDDRPEGFRLSPQQERLWRLMQRDGHAPYQARCRIRLEGKLEPGRFTAALRRVVSRHEILRTAFHEREEGLRQVILRHVAVAHQRHDLSGLPEPEAQRALEEVAAGIRQRIFDLERPPLLACSLVSTSPEEHVLFLALPALCADRAGLEILVRELAGAYGGDTSGGEPMQYVDVAEWQWELLESDETSEGRDYWDDQAATLPTVSPERIGDGFRPRRIRGSLPGALADGAARQGSSIDAFLLTCWQVILHRRSQASELAVATAFDGRKFEELAETPGLLARFLPMPVRLDGRRPFAQALKSTADLLRDRAEWQEYFDGPRLAVGESDYAFESFAAVPELVAAELRLAVDELEVCGERFVWKLRYVQPTRFELHYDAETVGEVEAGRLAQRWLGLLRDAIERPGAAVDELGTLSPPERHQLLAEWNDTAARLPGGDGPIHELFRRRAEKIAERIAVVFEQERWTYGELDRRSDELAEILAGKGVGPEGVVGICAERSNEMILALLGVLKAGGAYLPLDPDYPVARLAFMIADAHAPVLLVQEHLREAVSEMAGTGGPAVVPLAAPFKTRRASDSFRTPRAAPPRVLDDDNLAYVLYTSGSTGRPKGAMNRHLSLRNRILWMQAAYGLGESDRVLQKTPFSFDVSGWEFFWPLVTGATLVFARPGGHKDPAYLVDVMVREKITTLHFVPSMLESFLSHPGVEACRGTLRRVIASGEALPADLERRCFERLGGELHNLYGPTEAAIDVSYWACRAASGRSSVPIGRAISNVVLYVLDRRMEPAGIGIGGELHIGGVGLARGYRRRPGRSAGTFVPDPFGAAGDRLYKTGDEVRWLADGALDFLGRIDFQVKVRGFRIELGEIEATLTAHDTVRAAVAVARDAPGGDKRLVAYVVAAGGEPPAVQELRGFLQRRLPDYMVPADLVFLDELPLLPNGKVDRKALPSDAAAASREIYVVPRNEAEEKIARIWKDLLGVERVGAKDNFFDLGGHSLLLLRMRHRLQEEFDREISRTDLFRFPTVELLAELMGGGERSAGAANEIRVGLERATRRRRGRRADDTADVAIVGMAGRYPGARHLDELWENLEAGVESITFFSDEELLEAGRSPALLELPGYVKACGYLEDVDLFDARLFGINPRDAEATDPQHRVFLECAWEALENAGYDPETTAGSIGVFAGVGISKYLLNIARYPEQVGPVGEMQVLLGNDKDFLPTRVSYKLNLKGPSVNLQTACSTSLVAAHLACQALLAGECDMAMAGGVSLLNLEKSGYLYQEDSILSPDGHCRAFDARAQGTPIGSGAGIVVLKRLADAVADGDTIRAVIKGSAVNNDGSAKIGFTAPGLEGQASVIAEALAVAGVEPAAVSYVEAHGSGTALGDPIEVTALREVFGTEPGRRCALGSIKTNIGHTDAGAGAAGLIKTALALEHRVIPPSLHFETPNPEIDFDASPFFVATEATPWSGFGHPSEGGRRYAGVSSFGLGGTNAHVVLEEPPAPPESDAGRPWQLLVLSAASDASLEGGLDRLARHLEQNPGENLADVAFTYQVGRRRLAKRRIAVCRDNADAAQVLGSRQPTRLLGAEDERTRRPVAFLFPGLGDHYVNMGRELYDTEPAFREEIDRWSAFLEPLLGTDLRGVLYPGDAPLPSSEPGAGPDFKQLLGRGEPRGDAPDGPLERIEVAHPAICVIELALARLWREWGIEPESMIGYSLGEYTAACLAGVWTPEETLEIVAERARLIGELEPGAMLAVPLSADEVTPRLGETLALAALNTPGVTVVAGPAEAVDALERELEAGGVASRRLNASHAFHSPMMEPIAERFAARLRRARFEAPQVPFLSNVTGTWITAAEATDPDYWVGHLKRTVRFADGVGELLGDAERVLLEVGPGQALSSAARQHPSATPGHAVVTSLRDARDGQSDVAFALGALGQLWLAGAAVDWRGLHQRHRRRRLPLPNYAFDRRRYWVDTGKKPPARRPQGKNAEVGEWFYVPEWTISPIPPRISDEAVAGAAPWLVFADRGGLAERFAERLRGAGHDVVTVSAGAAFTGLGEGAASIDPRRSADYEALFTALRDQDRVPRTVAHFGTVTGTSGEEPDFEAFEQAQYEGLYSLFFIARALARLGLTEDIRLAVVSDGLHDVDAAQPPAPEKATMLGALRVIPQEYRNLAGSSIDVVRPAPGSPQEASLIERLVAEMAPAADRRAEDRFIAYRGRGRYVERYAPVPIARADPAALRRRGVYLVTGGFGEVGRRLTRYLAETARARLVLTGRSPCPAPEEWDAWLERHGAEDPVSRKIAHVRELEAAGAEVLAAQADVADLARMRELLDEIRERFGALHGVVHLAGELSQDKLFTSLEEAGPEACRAQFRAKVGGLYVLRDLLAGLDLDFCVLFSSLSSILGGLGFAAYAAGNTFMDAFARCRNQAGGAPWLSLDWDAWGGDDAGAAPSGAGLGSSLAGLEMTPAEAVDAFHRALSLAAASQVVISTGDLQARLEQWVYFENEPAGESSAAAPLHERPSLAVAYAAPESESERVIAELWQEHLGIAEVGRHDNFFQLGGDSLLATQLVSRLRQALRAELPLRLFFSSPTVAQLAAAVEDDRHHQEGLSEIEKAMQEIEGLSPDELMAEIETELSEGAT